MCVHNNVHNKWDGGELMNEKRKEYLKEYRKNKLKRIPLDVSPQLYEQIKAAADKEGESVNGLIRHAVSVYILRKK